jgi:hypothetical protein
MRDVEIGKIYRHFKGNYYYVKEVAIHSETGEEYVVYQCLYGEYKTFIRPKTMFLEKADLNRADNIFKQEYRFELVNMEENKI